MNWFRNKINKGLQKRNCLIYGRTLDEKYIKNIRFELVNIVHHYPFGKSRLNNKICHIIVGKLATVKNHKQ